MKKYRYYFAGFFGFLLLFYILVPQKAVGHITRITSVSRGSFDITEQLDDASLSEIVRILDNTKRLRWVNPTNVYPLNNDTIIIECEDASGFHRFLFVGSQKRFSIDSHIICNGDSLFESITNTLGAQG